ncbi:hypothetical protein [Bacillus altitudinis]|uniref:hypothetical protein n=1 Tax=Bacillus altitudinis TaxID=293387 RepID=UPI002E9C3FEE|nr:hypothetical protein [Bacillus altitudinis]MEE3613483.1 hypothetical protein [Bacillus altitudinis]MEE3649097.1 hypothetical protein [Bacillus altitudinis]MEE4393517.1 hypothetical protein [Bacillus altitudinis]MEE4397250.1 hypothetical protein [Bacillus altitudinis]
MTKQYSVSIKNLTYGSWVKSIEINSITETALKSDRHMFKDKTRANKILEILNEKYKHTYILDN